MEMAFGRRHIAVAVLLVVCNHGIFGAQAQNWSTAGWLNINCGATESLVDPKTGLTWVPDAPYISTGKLGIIPNASNSFPSFVEAQTLRYFDDPHAKKVCYTLPVTELTTYMLRANFFYGNYDGIGNAPRFEVSVDSSIFGTAVTGPSAGIWLEVTYTARSNVTFLCLLRDEVLLSVPLISAITLRPFTNKFQGFEQNLANGRVISTEMRANFGGTGVTRYPDDAYDRYWFGHKANSSFFQSVTPQRDISTTQTILNTVAISPPQPVLQTAVTTSGNLTVLIFSGADFNSYKNVELVLHFAELDPAANISTREFYISSDAIIKVPLQNPSNYTVPPAPFVASSWFFFDMDNVGPDTTVTLAPTATSLEGPILNGMQIFSVSEPSVGSTFRRDVLAFEAIKTDMNLTEWTGDPCLPVPHHWLNCTVDVKTQQVLITTVNLSGYRLNGTLSPNFAKLEALNSLHLENNTLSGPLPEWLTSLKLLTKLSVQDNNFSGQIPPGLLTSNNLQFTYQPGNSGLIGGTGNTVPRTKSSSSNVGIIVGVVVGVLLGLTALVILAFCIRKRRNSAAKVAKLSITTDDGIPGLSGSRAYSLAQVAAATDNYKRVIGKGGFGPVYYGKLDGREVAVKVASGSSGQGAAEFHNEVHLMSRVHHRNLVSLLGYCQEGSKQILIYEFITLGSLQDQLFGTHSKNAEHLDWNMRLNIALNAAQGLEYLHTGNDRGIIHRDVKSANILLTGKSDVAKVADFGISKLNHNNVTQMETDVKGSIGYLDPEYLTTNLLTHKSDVYGFGVVLLELMTGHPPIYRAASLAEWVRTTLQAGDLNSILDPAVKASHQNLDVLWKVAETALRCVEPKSVHRPTMAEVVQDLRDAYSMQQKSNKQNSSSPGVTSTSSLLYESNGAPSPR